MTLEEGLGLAESIVAGTTPALPGGLPRAIGGIVAVALSTARRLAALGRNADEIKLALAKVRDLDLESVDAAIDAGRPVED